MSFCVSFSFRTQVDWSEERTCFDGVATELSLYYSTLPEGALAPAATSTEFEPSDKRAASNASVSSATPSVSDTPKRNGVKGGAEGPAAGAGAGAAGSKGSDAELASPEATAVVQHVMYPAFRFVFGFLRGNFKMCRRLLCVFGLQIAFSLKINVVVRSLVGCVECALSLVAQLPCLL